MATAQAQYNGKATEVVGYDEEGEPILKEIRNAVDSTAFLKAAYEAETDEAKKAFLTKILASIFLVLVLVASIAVIFA